MASGDTSKLSEQVESIRASLVETFDIDLDIIIYDKSALSLHDCPRCGSGVRFITSRDCNICECDVYCENCAIGYFTFEFISGWPKNIELVAQAHRYNSFVEDEHKKYKEDTIIKVCDKCGIKTKYINEEDCFVCGKCDIKYVSPHYSISAI